MKICYDLEKGWRCSADGVRLNGNPPILRYKEKPVWTLVFFKDGSRCGTEDFGGAVSFRAAVDVDLNTETEVICRTTDESIGRAGLSYGELVVPVNANTSGFRTASDGQESRKAFFELWGFDTHADPVFYIRFEIRISGVVDPEGGVSPESVSPDTITRAEVMACLRAPDERQYTADPDDPSAAHSSQTGSDTYTRRRNSAAAGEWGPWEELLRGPQGIQGPQGSQGPQGPQGPQGETGSLTVPIQPYSYGSAYSALTCITYNGGGYQVTSGTSAGENPDTTPSKFICFARPGSDGTDGTDGAPGQDGEDGSDGENGDDGISPVISVTQTSSGVDIYTSDVEGETSGFVSHGSNGSLTVPIQEYSSGSAYNALTCITYNGGGYQVISGTTAGENPDNAPSKFLCFASAKADVQKISDTGATVAYQGHEVFKHVLSSGDVIAVNSAGLTSAYCVTAELWLDMPSTPVSFTLPGFTWVDGAAPNFTSGSTRYAVTVRWDGSEFLANLAYSRGLA